MTDRMTPDDFAALRQALDMATPGPWSGPHQPYDSVPWLSVYGADSKGIMHKDRSETEKVANANLTAIAPTLARECLALRAERDELAAEVARLRAAVADVLTQCPERVPMPAYDEYGSPLTDTAERHAERVVCITLWALGRRLRENMEARHDR